MVATPAHIQERIDRDVAEEKRQVALRAIFRQRQEAKWATERRERPPVAIPETGISPDGSPDPEGEGSDGFDYLHRAEGDWRAVCENQTGRNIPLDKWESLAERREEKDRRSVELAKALDSTGRFEGEFFKGEPVCWTVGLMSGASVSMPNVKRVHFFESVASHRRARLLRDIERFADCRPLNARFYNITNGPRARIHPVTLRQEIGEFHRFLSKVANHRAFKSRGFRMQLRSTEFGTPQWDETGQQTLHIHSHCVVTEPAGITKKARAKARKRFWKLFGVHWEDAGTIENVRECVKYSLKQEDAAKILREGGPGALADFYEATRGLHLVQPMGELREERRQRRDAAERITAFARPDGRSLEITGDWNAGKRPFAKRPKHREQYQLATLARTLRDLFLMRYGCSSYGRDHQTPELETYGRPETNRDRSLPRIANRVIARLAPAPYGTNVCEPAVVVWGYTGDFSALLAQPKVAAIIERHRAAYLRGRAACASAERSAALEGSQGSHNCPGAPPGGPPGLGELALFDAQNGRN